MRRRSRMQRTRTLSTPVIGGDMFANRLVGSGRGVAFASQVSPVSPESSPSPPGSPGRGMVAQLVIGGETISVQLSANALLKARKGKQLSARDLRVRPRGPAQQNYDLEGLIRKNPLPSLAEEPEEVTPHPSLVKKMSARY